MLRALQVTSHFMFQLFICSATERKLIFHVCKVQGMEVAISEI